MRAVANLFIARSRAAIVWFTVTVGVVVGTAGYVQSNIGLVRSRPQYVLAGGPSLFYIDPRHEAETARQMHNYQTQLALETMYNRGPNGLDHQARRFALFSEEANDYLNKVIVAPQVLMFRDTQAHQKVEPGLIVPNIEAGQGTATTVASGQVLRTSIENNTLINRCYDVKVFFTWVVNPNVSERAMFPTQCTSVDIRSTIQTFP